MPSITIKDVPPTLHEGLKKSAAHNRRSLQNEIIVCLERAIEQFPANKSELLEAASALRDKLPWVDHDLVDQYRRAGRP